jgi:uncharacterized protein (TIGR03084 family)
LAGVDARPTTSGHLLDDVEAEHRDFDLLVAGLDEDGLNQATPADGWAIRDQVSHLAFFDDAAVMAMTAPSDFTSLVETALAGGDPMQPHLDRGRSMSGPELLAWWRTSSQAMVDVGRTLPSGTRLPWFGPPMGTLSFFSARLMESWAHGQDVADALEITRAPTARLCHIAHLGVRARPFSYAARGLEVPLASVAVTLTGPQGQKWQWEANAGPDQAIAGPALDFCLVVTQRRHLSDTDLVVTGELAAGWMAIAQAFAGPPGPGRSAQGRTAQAFAGPPGPGRSAQGRTAQGRSD